MLCEPRPKQRVLIRHSLAGDGLGCAGQWLLSFRNVTGDSMSAQSTDLLTVTQAARSLDGVVSREAVILWIRRGLRGKKLQARRIAGRWFIQREDLREFLDSAARTKPR